MKVKYKPFHDLDSCSKFFQFNIFTKYIFKTAGLLFYRIYVGVLMSVVYGNENVSRFGFVGLFVCYPCPPGGRGVVSTHALSS